MSDALEIHRHDVFAVPLWVTRVQLTERLGMVRDVADLSGSPADLSGVDGPPWVEYRQTVANLADSLAERCRIGWRERSVAEWAMTFPTPDHVPAEREGLESHARATFTVVVWLAAPTDAGADAGLTLTLRNPFSHLIRRYKLPVHVHLPAEPGAVIVYPSFLEHFFEVPSPLTPWRHPAVALLSDFHYY